MKEFKGTKGEWEVYDDGRFPEIKLKDLYVGQICMMPYSDSEFEKAVNSKEENLANAKLIAAAPDMLMVLQKILDYNLEKVYPGFNKDTGIEKALEKALK